MRLRHQDGIGSAHLNRTHHLEPFRRGIREHNRKKRLLRAALYGSAQRGQLKRGCADRPSQHTTDRKRVGTTVIQHFHFAGEPGPIRFSIAGIGDHDIGDNTRYQRLYSLQNVLSGKTLFGPLDCPIQLRCCRKGNAPG